MPEIPQFVIDRVTFADGIFTFDEVVRWPSGQLDQFLNDNILLPAKNAKSVVCDGCYEDHCELVIFVEEPPGSPLRAYIPCPECGRVRVPLDRLKQWRVNKEILLKDSHSVVASEPAAVIEHILTDRQKLALTAMYLLKANHHDNLRSTEEIAKRAMGPEADANSLKQVMKDLRLLELVEGKEGRRGGFWLLPKGVARAEKLRKNKAAMDS